MKKCPFCAEQIEDEVFKCNYCGEVLSADSKEPVTPGVTSSQKKVINDMPLFIKGAIVYALIIYYLAKIVPTFGEVFDSFGTEIPPATVLLRTLSNFVERFYPLVILAAVGLLFLTDKVFEGRPLLRKFSPPIFVFLLFVFIGFVIVAMFTPMGGIGNVVPKGR